MVWEVNTFADSKFLGFKICKAQKFGGLENNRPIGRLFSTFCGELSKTGYGWGAANEALIVGAGKKNHREHFF